MQKRLKLSQKTYNQSVEIQWKFNGNSMEIQWKFMEIKRIKQIN